MSNYWDYSRDKGAQTHVSYPYDGYRKACRNQEGKVVASRAANYGMLSGGTTEMMQRIQEGPLAVGVSALNDCWRWYSDGVLSSAHNCPTNTDHVAAIVGLHFAEEGSAEADMSNMTASSMPADCPAMKNLQPTDDSSQDYWIVQNSWSELWGRRGFIRIAIEDGVGVSGINQYAYWMTVQ